MTFAKACFYLRSVKYLHKNLPQPYAATYFDTMSNVISSHSFTENDLISLQYVKTWDIQSLKEFCRKRGYKVYTKVETLKTNAQCSCKALTDSLLFPSAIGHLSQVANGSKSEDKVLIAGNIWMLSDLFFIAMHINIIFTCHI